MRAHLGPGSPVRKGGEEVTDIDGVPVMDGGAWEQDPATFRATPGSSLATRSVNGSRHMFKIGRDPASVAELLAIRPIWPFKLFEVECSAASDKIADFVNLVDVVQELPAHRAFGPRGMKVERFVAELANMAPEQWIRIAAAAVAEVNGSHHGPFSTALPPTTARALSWLRNGQNRRDRERGELTSVVARVAARESLEGAKNRNQSLFAGRHWLLESIIDAAGSALAASVPWPAEIREAALAPFVAVIGPIWETPKRTKTPPPAVPLAPPFPTPLTASSTQELACPGI